MSDLIRQSVLLQSTFQCHIINSGIATSVNTLQQPSLRKIWTTLRLLSQLTKHLLKRRYEHVYLTYFPYGAAFYKDSLLVLLCRLFGYTPWLHLHTLGFQQSAKTSRFRRGLCRMVFKRTRPICLSEKLSADISGLFAGKLNILPNGIPPIPQLIENVPGDGPLKVLFLSNLIKGKGILLVMEAMHILARKNKMVHLTVVGEEFDVRYQDLQSMAQTYGITDRISLLGPKYGHQKYEQIVAHHALVLPSDYDTFGLVLLEAMQAGLACVASRVGAMPEVLADGAGLILPERSAEAIAEAFVFLSEHPQERLVMGRKARERYLNHYTLQHFERRLRDLFMERGHVINIEQTSIS